MTKRNLAIFALASLSTVLSPLSQAQESKHQALQSMWAHTGNTLLSQERDFYTQAKQIIANNGNGSYQNLSQTEKRVVDGLYFRGYLVNEQQRQLDGLLRQQKSAMSKMERDAAFQENNPAAYKLETEIKQLEARYYRGELTTTEVDSAGNRFTRQITGYDLDVMADRMRENAKAAAAKQAEQDRKERFAGADYVAKFVDQQVKLIESVRENVEIPLVKAKEVLKGVLAKGLNASYSPAELAYLQSENSLANLEQNLKSLSKINIEQVAGAKFRSMNSANIHQWLELEKTTNSKTVSELVERFDLREKTFVPLNIRYDQAFKMGLDDVDPELHRLAFMLDTAREEVKKLGQNKDVLKVVALEYAKSIKALSPGSTDDTVALAKSMESWMLGKPENVTAVSSFVREAQNSNSDLARKLGEIRQGKTSFEKLIETLNLSSGGNRCEKIF